MNSVNFTEVRALLHLNCTLYTAPKMNRKLSNQSSASGQLNLWDIDGVSEVAEGAVNQF